MQSEIDASIAALTRTTTTPGAPFGYGADVSLASDLSPTLELVDPHSTRAIAEAILRRLDCPRGALPDDADYGIDLRSMCNRGITADEERALGGKIRAEVEKDDRIVAAVVRVTSTTSTSEEALTVQIVVTPADSSGTFELVLAATPAELLLEELRSR
jgi:hypothetical protein